MRLLTRAQARAFDQHAIETLGVPGMVLMENAAIGCVALLRELVAPEWRGARLEIVCGPGNNGGDGFAIARLALVQGAAPRVRQVAPPRAGSDAEMQAKIAARLGIPIIGFGAPGDPPLEGTVIVDALYGTGLDRALSATDQRAIEAMNAAGLPILAVDVPSGLDADRGVPLGAAVRATLTATMVAPKVGFSLPGAREWTGRVEVLPIGVPAPE
ncbi:MAG: NAD(P)H-hydrate epimerase [Phycisphaeraceae bacterium]|nr:NAD(P)H-hydrate epimerase [Phycisphaeraceae bacterium]